MELRDMKTPKPGSLLSEEDFMKVVMHVPGSLPKNEPEPLEQETVDFSEDRQLVRVEFTDLGPSEIASHPKKFVNEAELESKATTNEVSGCSEGKREERLFLDPPETAASRLRDQRIKQKLVVEQERHNLDQEELKMVKNRVESAGRRIRPDLERLEANSRNRQKRIKKRLAELDSDPMETLKRCLANVRETDALVKRCEDAFRPIDAENRRKKRERSALIKNQERELGRRKRLGEEKIQLCWK
jgi:hypothetical protein